MEAKKKAYKWQCIEIEANVRMKCTAHRQHGRIAGQSEKRVVSRAERLEETNGARIRADGRRAVCDGRQPNRSVSKQSYE